jgi:hypothetical protein
MTTTLTDAATWQTYATAVRGALSDLPKDEVDDLTDGLEADLAERAEDPLAPALGAPAEYAAELRAAAGIPVRKSGSSFATAVSSARNAWTEFVQGAKRHSSVSGPLAFFVSLRPVWWVYRAWVPFLWAELWMGSGIHPLPVNVGSFLILATALVLSVQFGRGRWLRWQGLRVVLVLLNIVLVVTLPIVVIWATNASGYGYY